MPRRILCLCALIAGLGGVNADAETFTFDLSGLEVEDGFNANFPTLTHSFGRSGAITEVALAINYESFDPSWQSEVVISLDTDGGFIDLFMGDFGAPDSPGVFTLAIAGEIIPPLPTSTGLVALTLWDFFNDGAVDPDARFGAGSTLTITFVPEPSTLAMVGIAALGGLGVGLRRRHHRVQSA